MPHLGHIGVVDVDVVGVDIGLSRGHVDHLEKHGRLAMACVRLGILPELGVI